MTTRIITYLLIIITTISCKDRVDKSQRTNEINRIVFATGGCYGGCPVQALSIDSTLTVKYHGVKFTDQKGFFIGHVNQTFWDTLNIVLESINYTKLDTLYEHSADDLSTEIFIYYKNKVKHIRGQSMSLPDSLMNAYNWIMTSQKAISLTKTNDSLEFETTIDKPVTFIPPKVIDES